MRQVTAREAVGSPAAVEVRKPVEEAHPWWRPALPSKPPGLAMGGTVEGGEVGRLGRVCSILSPLPAKAVRRVANPLTLAIWLIQLGRGVRLPFLSDSVHCCLRCVDGLAVMFKIGFNLIKLHSSLFGFAGMMLVYLYELRD